mmetsp:Transcript_1158/g.3818  ORF Transcript_1158/g.3818 Transcript_1158/m.3818 type:complete len:84 (-) Transcript_1158:1090-1341(-)
MAPRFEEQGVGLEMSCVYLKRRLMDNNFEGERKKRYDRIKRAEHRVINAGKRDARNLKKFRSREIRWVRGKKFYVKLKDKEDW